MNVLYTCDNNYIWIMGISVISLFENNKDLDDLVVYLLGEKISADNLQVLQKIADKYSRKIYVTEVPQLDISESLISARWPLSAFTRLFSGQLLPADLHEILYLDCDTIIRDSIKSLSEIDLTSYVCAGVKDCIGKKYKKNIGLEENDPYINAGVILFNLDELRQIDMKETLDSYMKKYLKLINYADQDILNGILKGKITVLPPRFDVMTITVVHSYEDIVKLRRPANYYKKTDIETAVLNPAIIHYTTNMTVIRPWFSNTNHPFANEFIKYMNVSPWANRKFNKMVFHSKESKIINVISKFPKGLSNHLLGIIHSELKPRYIKFKSNRDSVI